MPITWSFFLDNVQRKELETGYTINMETPFSHYALENILLGKWDDVGQESFIKLTSKETDELQQLISSRKSILAHYKEERQNAKQIAEKTSNAWKTYITLLNELSERESLTIKQIKKVLPSLEKIRVINEYQSFVESLYADTFYASNQSVSYNDLREALIERHDNAVDYVCLADDEENPFRLTAAAFILATEPKKTFNYLSIAFHRFRLNPTEENALAFVSVALTDLMSNLNIQSESPSSFEEMIDCFCSIAQSFIDQHKSIIDELSFESLQDDSVATVPSIHSSSRLYETEQINAHFEQSFTEIISDLERSLTNKNLKLDNHPSSINDMLLHLFGRLASQIDDALILDENSSNNLYEITFRLLQDDSVDSVLGIDASVDLSEQRTIEFVLSICEKQELSFEDCLRLLFRVLLLNFSKNKEFTPDKIRSIANEGKVFSKRITQEGEARQIVISINIIYLMSEVLRMIKDNDALRALCNNKEIINRYEKILHRKIDRLIDRTVYSELDDQESDLTEHRLEKGYDAKTLIQQERCKERDLDASFLSTVKDIIDKELKDVENQSTEELINTKDRIRKKIFECPDCDAKEELAEWIDSKIIVLWKAFVNNCEKNADEFDKTRTRLVSILGEQSKPFPKSAFDALITAEILYNRYAKDDEFAKKGFDYSSISALYYQSFEEAFNKIIWKAYADYLNKLMDNKETTIDDIQLRFIPGKNKRTWSYYMSDNAVSEYLTFGNFYYLLKEVKASSTAPMFCEYCSFLFGYNGDVSVMLQDDTFMKSLSEFAKAINKATPYRNNASHGGNKISKEQCRADKDTVLNELRIVRNSSLGLIQQLLNIVKTP